jgi:hypothetical protein
MNRSHDALTQQMLHWIAQGAHSYAEVLDVWKSSLDYPPFRRNDRRHRALYCRCGRKNGRFSTSVPLG